jgi:lysophospholipase L1-like esterase
MTRCNNGLFCTLLILAVSVIPCRAVPELLLPENDARFGEDDDLVVFQWRDPRKTHYEIEFGVDPEFAVGTGPIDVGPVTSYSLGQLLPEELWAPLTVTLFWRVRGRPQNETDHEWSDTFWFHKSTLAGVMILNGADGRYNHQSGMPYFRWSNPDGLKQFSMEFSMDPAFDNPFGKMILIEPQLDLSGIDRTDWDPFEGVFYWRASAETDAGTAGPWSDIGRLSKTCSLPPEIIGPEDGAVFEPQSAPPVLEWESLGTNEEYHIRLYADARGTVEIITLHKEFATVYDFAVDLGISDDVWHYAPLTLFWGVAGYDEEGRPGPFSGPFELIKPGFRRVAGYGDSITEGKYFEGGYLDFLHEKLEPVWGPQTSTVNIAVSGMKSKWGADNINSRLQGSNPQYVLIMFGTNDSVDPGNCDPPFDCDVAGNLAEMISIALDRGSIPIISTIIPVNPDGSHANAQSRIDENNRDIIEMAMQMEVELVDLDTLFRDYGDLSELFGDWGHPNEKGYRIMAQGFYEGIMRAEAQ